MKTYTEKLSTKTRSLIAIVALSLFTACAPTQVKAVDSCQAPTALNLGAAVGQLKATLSNKPCAAYYDDYFNTLLEIAKGAPGPENLTAFSDLIAWSYDQGFINKTQGQRFYTRHFSTTFVSMPDDRNVCSAARKKDELFKDMQLELQQKKSGILHVAGDKKAYYEAQQQHADLGLLLEAVSVACG